MRRHLYYYTLLPTSLQEASGHLHRGPEHWLPRPATPHDDGWIVELAADGALPRPVSRHRVVVQLDEPMAQSGRLLRRITWRSLAVPGLFPVLEGDLELVALHGDGCQISLMGTYRPPLSVAGGAADAVLGHHVAEACVRRFVLDIAERLEAVSLTA